MEGCLDHVSLAISSVSTTATKSEAVSTKVERGYIDRVDMWFAHSTSTPHVTMFSSNALTGRTKSIYDNKVTATNFSFYPRVDYQHTSGTDIGTNAAMGRILLFEEKVYIIATNATPGTTTQTIKANVIYERK
jgi:hypothetical protein